MTEILKIGTRGSPLALVQANDVRDRLLAQHRGLQVDIVVIRTTGDQVQDRPLAEIGGKGLFTKEIEEALFSGDIDLAVHSMKDVETRLPDGLGISTILPREDPRDAFISLRAPTLAELPAGAVIGTSSLRRKAQVKYLRPDLEVVPLRGNVETRLNKLRAGDVDATFLAYAGLRRLGMAEVATQLMDPAEMLPAVAQGAVGIEVRINDSVVQAYLLPLNDGETARRVLAERAMLAELDGSCRTPIAALAEFTGPETLRLRGLVASHDGTTVHEVTRDGPAATAEAMGVDAGRSLRDHMGPDFFG
ncbi:MAG: hydroxymethylbilane synthase [Proteobacteria bacterium]|jgi:hydroxymethylbilane synthase|nr:hydroxymethylbilane synthase [Pseudomonadota bacterium]